MVNRAMFSSLTDEWATPREFLSALVLWTPCALASGEHPELDVW